MKRKFSFLLAIFVLFFFLLSVLSSSAFSSPPSSLFHMGSMPTMVPDVLEPPHFSKSSCQSRDVLKESKTAIRFIKNVSDQQFIATGNIASTFGNMPSLAAPPFASGTNWIGKYDATKKPLWQYCFEKRTPAPMPDETIHDMIATPDGGYLGVGQSVFGRAGTIANGWVFKLNAKGELQWQRLFGRTFDKNFSAVSLLSVLSTPDQGSVIVGSLGQLITDSFCKHCGRGYALLMKLNADGGIQWQKIYGMDFEVNVYPPQESDGIIKESIEGGFSFERILPVADGGYFVTGTTTIFDSTDAWFARFDTDGNVLWQKVFGKAKANEVRGIRKDHDGNFIITGMLRLGVGLPWGLKLDPNGNVLWQKVFGKSALEMFDTEESIDQKGYVFAGRTTPTRAQMDSLLPIPQTLWIFQLDTNGNFIWQKAYRSVMNTNLIHLQRSADGYALRSGSDFFPIDKQGNMKKSPPKILNPVKVNFPSKKFTQAEMETDIHDYEIPISEE